MTRLLTKCILYFALLAAFCYMMNSEAAITKLLLLAAVFSVLNILIRPLVSIIAGALGMVTFGLPLLFINIPTLYLANAISGKVLAYNFWIMLLLSIVLFFADYIHRNIFRKYRPISAR